MRADDRAPAAPIHAIDENRDRHEQPVGSPADQLAAVIERERVLALQHVEERALAFMGEKGDEGPAHRIVAPAFVDLAEAEDLGAACVHRLDASIDIDQDDGLAGRLKGCREILDAPVQRGRFGSRDGRRQCGGIVAKGFDQRQRHAGRCEEGEDQHRPVCDRHPVHMGSRLDLITIGAADRQRLARGAIHDQLIEAAGALQRFDAAIAGEVGKFLVDEDQRLAGLDQDRDRKMGIERGEGFSERQ